MLVASRQLSRLCLLFDRIADSFAYFSRFAGAKSKSFRKFQGQFIEFHDSSLSNTA
jgi:hypothetical protein